MKEGSQVAIDDGSIEYESLCCKCYIKYVGPVVSNASLTALTTMLHQ